MNSGIQLRVPVTEADHSQGPKEAPVILVEYGDYECPFCARAYVIVKRAQKILKNDLRLIFRNFPLTEMHPNAMNAAKAAEAAGLQHKFWPMHDKLFEHNDDLEEENLILYAESLHLDLEKFTEEIANSKVEKQIMSDMYGGVRSGVNGTPTFFINSFRFDGDWTSDSFLYALEAAREQPSMNV